MAKSFRSGVSLHSHTNQSRETLKFLAVLGSRYAFMRQLMERLEQRAMVNHGMRVDYGLSYWTPPAHPTLAFDLERGQIERLGLAAMVSLTDHDSIQACLSLQGGPESRNCPISLEWTVPFGGEAFHFGVHNLPSARSSEWMQILSSYTLYPTNGQLKEILAALHAEPGVLFVFNHPMWDLYGVGADLHVHSVNAFLREHREWIHALELNGLRSWAENRSACSLAEQWEMVLVSGGDRHSLEPNANINLTNAECFDEFACEIRDKKMSRILFMPQYAQPLKHRVLQSAVDVVSHYPHFPAGSQRWDERVYHPDARGNPQSLATLWPDGTAPRAIRWGIAIVLLMGRGVFSGGLRAAWSEARELAQALEEQGTGGGLYPRLVPLPRKHRSDAGA
ncbi:hypothetical protein [Occallatibacter savannae]|uniref:hypothetical protein n=1 Tax=Occallatibacter savannae TaxID=1002691 RepID=UPI0019510BA8|nr:hypothetical protein [Occallatibacter savannae]